MKLRTRKNVSFFKQATILTAALCGVVSLNSAHAGAFKQLAEANNATYREVRDLGPLKTPSQVLAIQNKNFGPGLKALNEEHGRKLEDWKSAAKRIFAGTKAELAEALGLDATGKLADGGAAGSATAKDDKPAGPAGRLGAQTHTGEQEGSAGAKEAKFGGKREQAGPKVDPTTGLIMER